MDAGSEAVDLMVREGLQITEASIKLLAAGSKNLAAFIYALAKDNKRMSGRTNMGRLLRGKASNFFTTCRNGGKKCSISVQVPGPGKRLF